MQQSWSINPREPLNTRLWGEIATVICLEALQHGTSALLVERLPGGRIKITPETPAAGEVRGVRQKTSQP